MSLDVYLDLPHPTEYSGEPQERIFVRRDGRNVEITREEWDELYPDREPLVATLPRMSGRVYDANITHNLNRMATEAGIYDVLWRPDESGITHARQLIEPLRDGLALLQSDRERFEEYNPPNGWGDYDGLVGFVAGYLAACQEWPDAEVSVWR